MKIKGNSGKKNIFFGLIVITLAIVAAITVFKFPSESNKKEEKSNIASSTKSNDEVKKVNSREGQTNENGDLLINISDIKETATFYSYNKLGLDLEVLAVKAPDGTIRTAFNTCQVCYSSGRGYYVQQGDKLVCQNCGNRFTMSDVEVSKGGCNPVPISSGDKVVTDSTITISKGTLSKAKVIFENWKV